MWTASRWFPYLETVSNRQDAQDNTWRLGEIIFQEPVLSLLLSDSEIRRILDMGLALTAVTEAFRAHGEGRINMPPKVHLVLPRGSFKAMYGEISLHGDQVCGVKWNSNFPDNPHQGGLTIKGKLLLNDPATGLELADMDATRITSFRTGAAGALAV